MPTIGGGAVPFLKRGAKDRGDARTEWRLFFSLLSPSIHRSPRAPPPSKGFPFTLPDDPPDTKCRYAKMNEQIHMRSKQGKGRMMAAPTHLHIPFLPTPTSGGVLIYGITTSVYENNMQNHAHRDAKVFT